MQTERSEEEIEYSIHPPSPFITKSWQALLPDWATPVLSVLVMLQRSPVMLCQSSSVANVMKQCLRNRSIQLISPLVEKLHMHQYNATLFDPRTGLPYRSGSSGIPLNDVAVVHAVLGYTRYQYGQCHCLVHPFWGSNVYPTIMLASTTPSTLKKLASTILNR
ncbi:MAG: methylmalonic aciduria and homocystinuria type D protein [Cyanobacteria bacterium P01_F01_bin.150]